MSLDEEIFAADVAHGEGAADSGERKVFVDALHEITPRLHAYFRRRVEVWADADDCVVDVLAALWRRRAQSPEPGPSFDVWAFTTARGVLSNYRRGESRRVKLVTKLSRNFESRDDVKDESGPLDSTHVRQAIQALPERDRELVMLIAWDGLSVHEAGAALGLAAGAARARYSRARARLRDQLASGTGLQ